MYSHELAEQESEDARMDAVEVESLIRQEVESVAVVLGCAVCGNHTLNGESICDECQDDGWYATEDGNLARK